MPELPRTPEEAFEQHYVAFLDVLGFREIVTDAPADPNKYDVLRAITNINANHASDFELSGVSVKRAVFSDSIILSAPHNLRGLWCLLLVTAALAEKLLDMCVLLRGGIVEGQLHHSELGVFGPAIVQAYQLESEVAENPRVIVSQAVYRTAIEAPENWARSRVQKHLRIASDGNVFVHVLANMQREVIEALSDVPLSITERYARLRRAGTLAGALTCKVNEYAEDPKISKKYRWLCDYFNREIYEEFARRGGDECLQRVLPLTSDRQ